MDDKQMISFPRELTDELAELIAEKARVCGGGAFDIWEAICEGFGQPAGLIADVVERDEQEAFESIFPMPSNCTKFKGGYASTEFNAWAAQDYATKFKGWKARADLDKVTP